MIPSIDLMGGKAVQLRGGKEKEKVVERDDYLELASQFNRYGEIAVIDLDAAMGRGDNLEEVRKILKIGDCRVGGGIRSIEKAKELISLGARKVIIGSKAFEGDRINHEFLRELSRGVGEERVIIALDALEGEVLTQGWKHRTGLNLFDVVKELERYCSEFLFTCVEREGTLEGIDMGMVKKLRGKTERLITVAGGISSVEQIREISKLGMDVQLGMALYTGKIDIKEAFIESLDWNKLIPTITQDETGQVLTLAYSSRGSLKKTFETGRVWYFSRSRDKLWMKGETSGNYQDFLKVRRDCDRDALLITARQKGAACHTGSYSCFGDKRFSLYELYDVVRSRLKEPVPISYTAKLDDEMVRRKLLEEAKELVEAKGGEEVIWEVADLLYFLTVLLAKERVTIDDVLFELRRRRRG
jgi:phosphoribosyl-ATP pyrophosphohydrolase/phosphoribosyl-AMP cyclohydrolase